ncbi:MAG TPA: class I SAM-dependent methyltransferase [Pseudonocardiaceae bacterium]|nr:class I SAM-dependent methyltransferase [Pseudonocardiaceae bacterium]
MSEGGFGSEFDVRAVDFDALYRGGPMVEGMPVIGIPWDIGQAQPVVVECEQAGRISGAVLDVGCGLGENAIFLAGRGYRVTAVDASPVAIEKSQQRAAELGVDVEFAVADATSLDGYAGRFDSVLDSACYHCLDTEQRHSYAAALHRATKPGALLNLFCFAEGGMPAPMYVTQENLRDTLPPAGWSITDIRRVDYVAAAGLDEATARLGVHFETDPAGRPQLPAWAVQAYRVP